MPKRIQMTRQHPWRADNPDAVVVARPTKWGNPFKVTRMRDAVDGVLVWFVDDTRDPGRSTLAAFGQGRSDEPEYLAFSVAVEAFEREVAPTLDVAALRGRDLACWCPLDQPCHADVLLELANAEVA
jgi:hypothetical protein